MTDNRVLSGLSNSTITGKNKLINGDFYINQRNFSSSTTALAYCFDRWIQDFHDGGGGTTTYSLQTFTPGIFSTFGYEAKNYIQIVTSGQSGTSTFAGITQCIEDVRTFAGQKITVSCWAKASSGTPSLTAVYSQQFGAGGSSPVYSNGSYTPISTSWGRYSWTLTIPSVSGKTINNNNNLSISIYVSDGNYGGTSLGVQNNTFHIWGVQAEAGPVATPFSTATGTIQGELAACQRYYFRNTANATWPYAILGPFGFANTISNFDMQVVPPVTMRTTPTSVEYGNLWIYYITPGGSSGQVAFTSATLTNLTSGMVNVAFGSSSAFTIGSWGKIQANNNASAYIGFSAEL